MTHAREAESLFPDQKEPAPAILIVEDEVLLRMAISDYLQECGFKIYEAGTASEAIEMIESGRFAIDLVFSDIRMPGELDGFGLAQWVRKNRPGLPVILTSGDAKKSEAAKAPELEKAERDRLPLEMAGKKSPRERLINIADKMSKLRSILASPPSDEPRNRALRPVLCSPRPPGPSPYRSPVVKDWPSEWGLETDWVDSAWISRARSAWS
jgi:CheY-like chemotaxis protein